MDKFGLSSPWMSFFHEIEALFKGDPEVTVRFDEEENTIKLFVDNTDKAEALSRLLPSERAFGGVTVQVKVIPANHPEDDVSVLLKKAFDKNPAMVMVKNIDEVFSNPITYVVFKKEVVQYFNDDLGDLNGNHSTLYQDIAKDVFLPIPGAFFCTAEEKNPIW